MLNNRRENNRGESIGSENALFGFFRLLSLSVNIDFYRLYEVWKSTALKSKAVRILADIDSHSAEHLGNYT